LVASEKVNVSAARWLWKKRRGRTDDGVIWLEKSTIPEGRARPTFRTKDLESVLQNDIIQKENEKGIVGKASKKTWRLSTTPGWISIDFTEL